MKPWPALRVVFKTLLVESNSPLHYSSIYNLQFAAFVKIGLREADDCNDYENLENMCFKNIYGSMDS